MVSKSHFAPSTLYLCNPSKAVNCPGTKCYLNGGTCHCTRDPYAAYTTADAKPVIVVEFGEVILPGLFDSRIKELSKRYAGTNAISKP